MQARQAPSRPSAQGIEITPSSYEPPIVRLNAVVLTRRSRRCRLNSAGNIRAATGVSVRGLLSHEGVVGTGVGWQAALLRSGSRTEQCVQPIGTQLQRHAILHKRLLRSMLEQQYIAQHFARRDVDFILANLILFVRGLAH